MKKQLFLAISTSLLLLLPILLCHAAEHNPDVYQANSYCEQGDKILNYYENLKDKTDSDKYLKAAKYYYYQASRVDISNQNSLIGMARIALHKGKTRDAKNALMMALNFDETNPKVSYYLGEAFFAEGEYFQAIDFYTWAYNHGYQSDYKTNYKLGVCYEKLNDTEKARFHYQKALSIKPNATEAKNRLNELNTVDTNYQNVQYEDEKIDQNDIEKLNLPNI